jgi:hypothetical protein
MRKILTISSLLLFLAACSTPKMNADYSQFREADPHSILVLPALNQTVSIEAPEFFLSTVSKPFAERGYYTFPAHMVKRTLEEEGLSDTLLIYEADAASMGRLFNCDSALYITIEKWESKYLVLSTTTTVEFSYELKSCHSGQSIWRNHQVLSYTPDSNSSGNPLADLVVMAVTAAIEKAAPNYIPLAQQANSMASITVGRGLPAGPYLPDRYKADLKEFPVAELVSNGTEQTTE